MSANANMDMTMGAFIEIYFRDKAGELKERSVKNKRYMIEIHVLPYFENKPMNSITPSDIIQGLQYIKTERYSHRLSGLVVCADCGGRMNYSSAEAQHRKDGKVYDSDDNFKCSNYKNKYHECSMHFVKTSVLETLILGAVQGVSRYVLGNEAGFIEQIKSQWNAQQERSTTDDKKELPVVRKRIEELDVLIKGLYENSIAGKIPERQYQRLMMENGIEYVLVGDYYITNLKLPEENDYDNDNQGKESSVCLWMPEQGMYRQAVRNAGFPCH